MKRFTSVLSSAAIATMLIGQVSANAASPISVVVNGERQTYSQPPVLENNSVLVPLRGIFESLQAEVNWNDKTQQITVIKEDKTISLQIGSTEAKINDKKINISTAQKLKNDSTLVPLRFICESFGAEVDWQQADQSVTKPTKTNDGANLGQNQQTTEPKESIKDQIVKAEYAASLSQEAFDDKNYNNALTKINQAITLDPSNNLYYYRRGLINEELSKLEKRFSNQKLLNDKAFEDYTESVNLNDQFEPALIKLIDINFDKKEYEKALPLLEKAIHLNPNNDKHYVNRAYICFRVLGQKENAAKDMEKAIKLNPKNGEYKALLDKYSEITYTEELVNNFIEVTTANNKNNTIRRWEKEMRVAAYGTPTEEDKVTIQNVASEINLLLNDGKITVVNKNENPNVEIHFISIDEFEIVEPDSDKYKNGQMFLWSKNGNVKNKYGNEINSSTILIAQNRTDQSERNYLIRKMITQSLGLPYESWGNEGSIFYAGNKQKEQYSDTDKQLVKMLYYQEIKPGMDKAEIKNKLLD